jgi:predicted secreted Zn-dependent protease
VFTSRGRATLRGLARSLFAGFIIFGLCAEAAAGVRSSTATRYYSVGGTTKVSLASRMRSNPFRGDHGGAVANIRPKYSLKVSTKPSGGSCRVTDIDLTIHFVMTLPRANEAGMAAGTRASWRGFVAFARRHEATHRSIYLQCAQNFLAKARTLSGASCPALQARARQLLNAEDRACDRRHAAFDRSERRRLGGQPLFRR